MTRGIIGGTVVSVAFTPANGITGYYINVMLNHIRGTGNDACGETQPPTYAGNAASAMYTFCLALKDKNMAEVATRFNANDAANADSTTGVGVEGLAKFFIDTQEFTTTEVCRDYGITWRRDMDAGKVGLVPKKVQF